MRPECHELLSNFAFKFKLRRYSQVPLKPDKTRYSAGRTCMQAMDIKHWRVNGKAVQVDPIKPTLKPPGTKRLKLQC